MEDGPADQIGDELEFQQAALEAALIAAAREGFGQRCGHRLTGAVLEEHPPKRAEPALRIPGDNRVLEQGRGHAGQKPLDLGREPLVERLLGIGNVGGQADDGGDALQREDGFGPQRDQGGQQGGDGDLARGALEKARRPRQGFGGQLCQPGGKIPQEVEEHHVRRRD